MWTAASSADAAAPSMPTSRPHSSPSRSSWAPSSSATRRPARLLPDLGVAEPVVLGDDGVGVVAADAVLVEAALVVRGPVGGRGVGDLLKDPLLERLQRGAAPPRSRRTPGTRGRCPEGSSRGRAGPRRPSSPGCRPRSAGRGPRRWSGPCRRWSGRRCRTCPHCTERSGWAAAVSVSALASRTHVATPAIAASTSASPGNVGASRMFRSRGSCRTGTTHPPG